MPTPQPEPTTAVDRREVRELAEASQSLASEPLPDRRPIRRRVESLTETVVCRSYDAHRRFHKLTSDGWICPACKPPATEQHHEDVDEVGEGGLE
jgi:hypothetical protein